MFFSSARKIIKTIDLTIKLNMQYGIHTFMSSIKEPFSKFITTVV